MIICLQCGGEFPRDPRVSVTRIIKYCSRACTNAARKLPARYHTCEFCGVSFLHVRGRHDVATKYCSNTCAAHATRPAQSKVRSFQCVVCQRCVCRPDRGATRSLCSEACRNSYRELRQQEQIAKPKPYNNDRYIQRYEEQNPWKSKINVCMECGQQFNCAYRFGDGVRLFCSAQCGTAAAKKVTKARRRSKTSDSIRSDSARFGNVWNRDGGRCHVCGLICKQKKLFVDKHDPLFPTMDHITPLALGGAHTEANCGVAHLLCNCLKGCLPVSTTMRTIARQAIEAGGDWSAIARFRAPLPPLTSILAK